jgi:hypothetical protein
MKLKTLNKLESIGFDICMILVLTALSIFVCVGILYIAKVVGNLF